MKKYIVPLSQIVHIENSFLCTDSKDEINLNPKEKKNPLEEFTPDEGESETDFGWE